MSGRGSRSRRWYMNIILLLVLTCMLLPGCVPRSHDRVPTPNMGVRPYRINTGGLLQDAVERGTLRIGIERDYPPFSYHDAEGRLKGFDVDIAEEVAYHMELNPEFIEMSWEQLLPGLSEGVYDVVFDEIAVRDDRRQLYDFSHAYMTSFPVVVVRDEETRIRSFSDLKGQRTAVPIVGSYRDIAEQIGADIREVQHAEQGARQLMEGAVDAAVMDNLSAANLMLQFPDRKLRTVQSSDHVYQVCAAMTKGNNDLLAAIDNALLTMKSDGTYAAIWEKYFGSTPSNNQRMPEEQQQP
ncbi:ABC transporter substrate-binding protein [Paenibacillus campinasensis]|uniref:ABC transporter substrate-binding protein n=2 Tax=Paenibacillus campinasensis TaxID=66347 RepID=A0A268F511_9BACL|nr:ABC transporter substrate-binding protein [Paenibacillus campinasensis]